MSDKTSKYHNLPNSVGVQTEQDSSVTQFLNEYKSVLSDDQVNMIEHCSRNFYLFHVYELELYSSNATRHRYRVRFLFGNPLTQGEVTIIF